MKNIWMTLAVFLIAGVVQAQSATGTLLVSGQAGKFQIFQKVKAVRCDTTKRGACDAAVFLSLNTPQAVAAGTYIVGFENSINPGLVSVNAGGLTKLNLETIKPPVEVKGQRIRIFRDLSNSVEQRKIMMSMYYMNRHFFRLEKENFGDLYLTSAWDRDFVQHFTYEVCANISTYGEPTEEGVNVCNAWNSAKGPEGLQALYVFAVDGTMVENWASIPGDVHVIKHPRYLVSAPLTDLDSVAVFAGAYQIQSEAGDVVTVRVGN